MEKRIRKTFQFIFSKSGFQLFCWNESTSGNNSMPTLVIAYSRIKCSFSQDLIVGKKINCQLVRLINKLESEKDLLAATSLRIASKWLLEALFFFFFFCCKAWSSSLTGKTCNQCNQVRVEEHPRLALLLLFFFFLRVLTSVTEAAQPNRGKKKMRFKKNSVLSALSVTSFYIIGNLLGFSILQLSHL